MNSDRTVKEHFQAIVDLSADERSVYLDEQCTDASLRKNVQLLLDAFDAATSLMEQPAKEMLEGFDVSQSPEAIPQQIGDFRIIREIGRGGMAIAYLAEDTTLNRQVALKILPRAFGSSEQSVARFRHEARAIARLRHPNIVPIYRVGEDDGVHYIAMEYIEGLSLGDKLKKLREVFDPAKRSTRTKSEYLLETAILLAQVADAIEHAHQHEIIHRDVKPTNILIDTEGKPRLADFGIAKNLAEETLTQQGNITGTCRYMSPEQANIASTTIDHRTDIFSLGVVLYESITFQLPFDGETPQQILNQVISKRPRQVGSLISKDLETICHKAIEKDPKDRYQTAAHLAADLRCFVAGSPILARPPSLARRTRHVLRGRRQVITLLVSIPVIATAAVFGYQRFTDDQPMLTIKGDPRSIVYLHPIDVELDRVQAPIRNATLESWQEVRLAPGYYRIVIEGPNDGFSEASRYLAREQVVEIDAKIRSSTEITEQGRFGKMVRIASGEESIAPLPRPLSEYQMRVLSLPAFWIDMYEVSNKQYQAFLADTGRTPPAFWEDDYPPKNAPDKSKPHPWDDLPVVGVTFLEAQSYAEWAGKRLPTCVEWERAARGTEGHLFPWGDEELSDAKSGNVYRVQQGGPINAIWREAILDELESGWTYEVMQRFYGDNVYPVSDLRSSLDQTAEGIVHLFGNVMEWTETIPVENTSNEIRALYHLRVVCGRPWGISKTDGANLTWINLGVITKTRIARGFRCAKSISTKSSH